MDAFHAAAAVLTDWLLETTLHVAVLFALVLAVTTIAGRRLPTRWRHALWALLIVRLLMPALPSSPASVHNVTEAVARPPVVDRVRAPRTVPTAAAHVGQLVPYAGPEATVRAAAPAWPWRSSVALVWLAGAALVLGRLLVVEMQFARVVTREPQCTDPRVLAALEDALRSAGVRRHVRIVRSDLGGGPALTGVLRPRILVPGRVLDELSGDELRHVIAHEVAHLAAGDVLQNWLLAVLEAVHWFDPLVRLAARRVRTERESLRDLAATRGSPQEGRTAYGRTLLRLLDNGTRSAQPRMAVGLFERNGDLRRRIEMIAKGSGGRRAWVVGAGLTAAVAVVALTGATPRPVQAQDGSTDAAGAPDDQPVMRSGNISFSVDPAAMAVQAGPRIEVVRRTEPPEWEARVNAALAKPIVVHFEETPLRQVVEYIGEHTGLNTVIHPRAQEDAAELTVTLTLENVSARQALRLALQQAGMTFGLVDGAIHVGFFGNIRAAREQRFYKIATIVDAMTRRLADKMDAEELASYADCLPEDLVALCQNYAGSEDDWMLDGVSIAVWGDVLVVDHEPAMHAEVERVLNTILTRGADVPPAPAWRSGLETKLGTRVSFAFEEAALEEVLSYLSQATGASIVVGPNDADDVVVTLKLDDVTGLEAVNWVARQTFLHAAFQDGAVVLTHSPPTPVRMYDVSGFFPEGSRGTYDALMELIVCSVAPVSWEDIGSVEFYDEMLIVRNTEDVHAQVVEFLEVAKRAQEK